MVGKPGAGEGVAIAAQPQPRGLPGRHPLSADRRDPPAPEPDEVVRRLAGGRHVVDHHVVGWSVVDPLAQQDHRRRVGAFGQVVAGESERAEDEAVDQLVAQAADDLALAVVGTLCLVDQNGPAVQVCLTHQMPGEFGEVRHVQLGNRQGDDAGTSTAQAARRQVGPVVESGDRAFDPAAGLRPHVYVAVHDVRHGLRGHPGKLRDVSQRCRHRRLLTPCSGGIAGTGGGTALCRISRRSTLSRGLGKRHGYLSGAASVRAMA